MDSRTPPAGRNDETDGETAVYEAPLDSLGLDDTLPDVETADLAVSPSPDPSQEPGAEAGAIRRRCLSPFLEELRTWASQTCGDPMDIPHFAEVAWNRMELGQRERAVLKKFAEKGDAEDRAFNQVTDGVAYQIKCSQLIEVFEHGPMPQPSELPAFLDELVAFVAVGIALQYGLQSDIDRCIASGETLEAKSTAGFRERISRCLNELDQRIGAVELERATRQSQLLIAADPGATRPVHSDPRPVADGELVEEPERHTWASYAPKPEAKSLPPWLSEDIPLPESKPVIALPEEARNRVKPLSLVLAGLVAIYFVMLLMRPAVPTKPILSMENFSHVAVVQTVKARPPSLYITVSEQWDELSIDERKSVLEEIGKVADIAGYSGAVVRGSDRVTVGQWMRKTGAEQIERPGGASLTGPLADRSQPTSEQGFPGIVVSFGSIDARSRAGARRMPENFEERRAAGKGGSSVAWRSVVLVALVLTVVVSARTLEVEHLDALREWIAGLGDLAPVAFVAIYIVGVVAAVPGSVLTISAGVLFGPVVGTMLVSVGSTVGAGVSFLIARYLARKAVAKWLAGSAKFRRLDRLTERRGAAIVAVTRLVPLFPFNLLNYGFGLTRVRFGTYIFWSWLCMLPSTVIYVVGGDAVTRRSSGMPSGV